ncbi:hypothetical protein ACFL3U_04305 [Pseudomonadota bacterium]
MSDTLVIQSHRTPLPYTWITRCLKSVNHWAESNHYHYQFMGDELFDLLPEEFVEKRVQQPVMFSDLARLLCLRQALQDGYQRAIWLDTDFLIFNPSAFMVPDEPYAVGREAWVQHDKRGKLRVYKKVHNAFLMFCQDNHFLDFYIESATRLLSQNTGNVPPHFIGPKLLTALHNVVSLPVMESAGMLSPLVIKDLIQGSGIALDQFVEASPQPIAGANLCISSCQLNEVSEDEISKLIDRLVGC